MVNYSKSNKTDMKLLSIDVGIKNLAFCLLRVPDTDSSNSFNSKHITQSSQFEILLWDVVGISQSEQEEAAALQRSKSHPLCSHSHYAKTQCKSKAAFFYYSHSQSDNDDSEPVFTCKRHSQSSSAGSKQVISMTLPQIAKLLKSGSNDSLLEFCNSFHSHNINNIEGKCKVDTEPKTKRIKSEIIARVNHLLKTNCLFQYEHARANRVSDMTELLTTGYIIKKPPASKMTEKDASAADTVSLISVGHNLMQKFDSLFYSENSDGQCYNPDRVVIENQISPIATRMKTVQGMVTQYFLMRGVSKTHISYISATNKLKAWSAINSDAEIDTYDDRKKTGIACVRTMLSPTQLETLPITGMSDDDIQRWRTVFESHKKKDDMADSLLQGISCL